MLPMSSEFIASLINNEEEKQLFEVEITIKTNKFVRVKVTDTATGNIRVRVPQHFDGDWEEHARKVAKEMVENWKREETKVITYTLD